MPMVFFARRFVSSSVRRLAPLSLGLGLFLSCAPQVASAPPVEHAAPAPVEAPSQPSTPGLFLYAAERDGNTTLLLGTIHLGFGFSQVLTPSASERFGQARLVMAEMDPSADSASRVMEAGMLPRGESSRALLGEPLYSSLVARLSPRMPEPVLASMKPWLIGVVIAMDELGQALQQRGADAQVHRMDEEMLDAAKRSAKPLSFFETAGEQLGFLEAVPLDEQRDELAHMLTPEAHAQTEAMVDAYARGDERALTAACFTPEHMERAPAFFEQMLYARNARWLPVLLREHAAGGSFIGVGVAHLLGPRGLLVELQKQGFAIRRLQ